MLILNLGFGTKVSANPNVIIFDWSMYLRMKENPFPKTIAPILFNGEKLKRFHDLPSNVMLANIAKGISFPSNSDALRRQGTHQWMYDRVNLAVCCLSMVSRKSANP